MKKFLQIPATIPRYRFLGTLIALTLSSAIFSGDLLLINSLNQGSQDFFGAQSDILVFYDDQASTPFSSIVPTFLEVSFENHFATVIVSPELFQPVIHDNEPLYIRGVKFEKVLDLEKGRITTGRKPNPNQIYEVLVGSKLNIRFGFKIGEWIDLESIIEEEIIQVKVVGIYESDLIAGDEILTSLAVARVMAGYDKSKLTHYRVKFDPRLADKETILSDVTTLQTFDLFTDRGHDPNPLSSYRLTIWDNLGNKVYKKRLTSEISIELFRGHYTLLIELNLEKIRRELFEIKDHDLVVRINLDDSNLLIEGLLTFEDIPIPGAAYQILDNFNASLISGVSDSSGKFQLRLTIGNYSLIVKDDLKSYRFSFSVKDQTVFKFNILPDSQISINELHDGIILTRNEFDISMSEITRNTHVLIDDVNYNFSLTALTTAPVVRVNLSDGQHTLTLKRMDLNHELLSVDFVVNSSIIPFQNLALRNYVHYQPNLQIPILTEGINIASVQAVDGEIISNSAGVFLKLPNDEGFYKIVIRAKDTLGFDISRSYIIIIEANPEIGGLAVGIQIPVVAQSDEIPLWINEIDSVTPFNGSLGIVLKSGENYNYIVPNMVPNTYTDVISNGETNFLISYTIVKSYFSLFQFANSTGNFEFDNIIHSSEFSVIFPSLANYREDHWFVELNFTNGFFSVYPDQLISVPGNNVLQSGTIKITNNLTNRTETNSFFALDQLNSLDRVYPKYGIPSEITNGILDLSDLNGIRLNATILRDGTMYRPINLGQNQIILAPGTYFVNLYQNNLINTMVSKNVTVIQWTDLNTYTGNYISFKNGFLLNTTARLYQFEYQLDNSVFITRDPDKIEISGFRNLESNQYQVEITGLFKGNYSTSINQIIGDQIQLKDTKLIFDNLVEATIEISFTGLNLRNELVEATFQFKTGNLTKTIDIIISDLNSIYTENLSIYFELTQTRQNLEYDISLSNLIFQISIVPQNVKVTLVSENLVIFTTFLFLNDTLTVLLGNPKVRFQLYHPNYGEVVEDPLISILNFNQALFELVLNNNVSYSLEPGIYVMQFSNGIYEQTKQISITKSGLIVLEFEPVFETIDLTVNNIPNGIVATVSFEHLILQVTSELVNYLFVDDTIRNVNLLVGVTEVVISGEWGRFNTTINITAQPILIGFSLSESQGVNWEFDLELGSKLNNLNIKASVGSDYLDNYLGGALIILQLILFAQVIVIVIVIMMNFIQIFSGVTYESKKELLILKNIGATTKQSLFAYSKFLLITSLMVSITGFFLGSFLLWLLFRVNVTVYFGHQFDPQLTNLPIFIFNIIFTVGMTIISSFLALRNELRELFE